MRLRLLPHLALAVALLAAPAHAQEAASPCAQTGPVAAELREGAEPGAHAFVSGGVRLWYCVAGEGPAGAAPVVFLHGGPGEGSFRFASLAGSRLERGLRVVYFDQRGSGRSERPADGTYTLAGLVEDVEALRKALGAPKISLVSHSFGGVLALEYAAKHPERVARLVSVAGLSDVHASGRSMCRRLAELHPEAHARVANSQAPGGCNVFAALQGAEREAFMRGNMFPDAAVAARVDSVTAASGVRTTGEMSRALFAAGFMNYRFAGHERLSMPVLVIAGAQDHQVGLESQRALAEGVANGRLEVYERAGHYLYVDEADRFARDVTAFLAAPAR
jgi:proline iminopeptidase